MRPEVKAKWRDPMNVFTFAATLLVAGIGIYLSTRPVFEGALENLLFAWMTASLAAIIAASNRDSKPAWRMPLVLMLISLFQLILALHFLRML